MISFFLRAQTTQRNDLRRYAEPSFPGPIALVPTGRVRQPLFLQRTAKQLKAFNISSDKTPDFVDAEIHLYHTGPLYDEDGSLLDPMAFQASEAFPEGDPGRWITKFLKCADKPYERLLQLRCVRRVQFLHAALQINYARYGAPF